jgi:hypothetical protein
MVCFRRDFRPGKNRGKIADFPLLSMFVHGKIRVNSG